MRHCGRACFVILSLNRGDEFLECGRVERRRRHMRLLQENIAELVFQSFLQPEFVARIVFALQCLEAFNQGILLRCVGGAGDLQRDQVGFDDVLGRRQYVGDQILALNDALIDRAVDLEFVERLERPRAVYRKTKRKYAYQ